jgi:hypothetical protein
MVNKTQVLKHFAVNNMTILEIKKLPYSWCSVQAIDDNKLAVNLHGASKLYKTVKTYNFKKAHCAYLLLCLQQLGLPIVVVKSIIAMYKLSLAQFKTKAVNLLLLEYNHALRELTNRK